MGKITDTPRERTRKLERENRLLTAENERLRALQDYNIMMGNLEDPAEEEGDDE